MIFRKLNDEQTEAFRQWARDSYRPFSEIKGIWHPVVQEECVKINNQIAEFVEE